MASLGRSIVTKIRQTTVASLKFSLDAGFKIEKFVWLMVALGGTILMIFVVFYQVVSWQENPVLTNTLFVDLDKFDFPAITFCHRGNTRLDIMERLANSADPQSATVRNMRNSILRRSLTMIQDTYNYGNLNEGLKNYYSSSYQDPEVPSDCQVRQLF